MVYLSFNKKGRPIITPIEALGDERVMINFNERHRIEIHITKYSTGYARSTTRWNYAIKGKTQKSKW
jgi:hypothetical protein